MHNRRTTRSLELYHLLSSLAYASIVTEPIPLYPIYDLTITLANMLHAPTVRHSFCSLALSF